MHACEGKAAFTGHAGLGLPLALPSHARSAPVRRPGMLGAAFAFDAASVGGEIGAF